jgi:DNA repair protein RadC
LISERKQIKVIQKRNPIRYWPESERPREKLIKSGAASLSSAGLIAILITSGTIHLSAIDVARKLLEKFHTLDNLANASLEELQQIEGIGPAKAITLMAAFQISSQRMKELAEKQHVYFKQPNDVAQFFIPEVGYLKQEQFAIALLDASGKFIHKETISRGILNASLVHPREVFKAAIKRSAAAIILIHNHPSGELKPSQEDINITQQMLQSGQLLNIPVYDHIIIAGEKYLSMKEEGFI